MGFRAVNETRVTLEIQNSYCFQSRTLAKKKREISPKKVSHTVSKLLLLSLKEFRLLVKQKQFNLC